MDLAVELYPDGLPRRGSIPYMDYLCRGNGKMVSLIIQISGYCDPTPLNRRRRSVEKSASYYLLAFRDGLFFMRIQASGIWHFGRVVARGSKNWADLRTGWKSNPDCAALTISDEVRCARNP